MEIIDLNSLVVRKILDLLSIDDVHNCRIIGKTWYQEVVGKMKTYPPIDTCTILVKAQSYEKERGDYFLQPSKRKHVVSCYFKHVSYCSELQYPEMSLQFGKYFGDEKKCIPSFSLISYEPDPDPSRLIDKIQPNHPTVKVVRSFFKITPHLVTAGFPPGWIYELEDAIRVYFEIIQLNRYISKHKIIITDWSDPENVELNLHDEAYPVESIIVLTPLFRNSNYLETFDEFAKDHGLKVSGGASSSDFRDLSFFDVNTKQWRSSQAISIAFAGRAIKSAVFKYRLTESPEEEDIISSQLDKLSESLNFSTDDGGVLGFSFFNYYSPGDSHDDEDEGHDLDHPYHYCGRIYELIISKFPRVNFVYFFMDALAGVNDENLSVHLIKV